MEKVTAVEQSARRRREARLATVVATIAAALGLWIAYAALGIDLRSPAFGEYGGTASVGPANVAFASALAAFAAWGLLAVLERVTRRAGRVWFVIAVLALVASIGGPMSGTGITTANRIELLGFHIVVGAVLIPLLHRTSPRSAASSMGRHDERHRTEAATREVAA